jgi:hypothetical protein
LVTLLGRLSIDKGAYQARVSSGGNKNAKMVVSFSSGEVLVAQIQCVPVKPQSRLRKGGMKVFQARVGEEGA